MAEASGVAAAAADEALGAAAEGGGEPPREFDIMTLKWFVSDSKWPELEKYLKVLIDNKPALNNQPDEGVILRHASLFLHCRRGQLSLMQHEGHQQAVSYLEQSIKPLRESASEFTNIENLNQIIHGIAESVENNEELIVDTASVMDAITNYLRLHFPVIIGEFDIMKLQQLVSQSKWPELEEYLKFVIENRPTLDNPADEDVILRHASLFLHCRRGQLSVIQHEGHQQVVSYLEQSVKPLRESASEFTNIENLNQTIHGIAESVENHEQLMVDTGTVMDAMTDYLRLYFPKIIGHDPKQPHNPSTYHDFVLSLPGGTNEFRCLMCQNKFDTRPTNFFKPHIRRCRNVTKNVTNRLDRLMLLKTGKSYDMGPSGKRKRTINDGQSYSLGNSSGHQNKNIGGLVDTATKLLSDLAAEYHQLERNPDQFGKAHLELEKVLASIKAKASSSEQGQSSLLGGACFLPGAQVLQQGTSNYYGFQGPLPTGVPSLRPLLQQQVHNYETAQQQHVLMQQQQQQRLLQQQQQQQWVLQQQQNQQVLQQHQNQQVLQQHQNQHQQVLQQHQNQQVLQQHQNQQVLQQHQNQHQQVLQQHQNQHQHLQLQNQINNQAAQQPPLFQQQQHHQEPPLNNQGSPLVPLDPGSPSFNVEDFLLDDELLLGIEEPDLPQEQLPGGPLPQQPPVLQQLLVPAPPQPPVPPQQENQS